MSNFYLVLIVLISASILNGFTTGIYEGLELQLVGGAVITLGPLIWLFRRSVRAKKKSAESLSSDAAAENSKESQRVVGRKRASGGRLLAAWRNAVQEQANKPRVKTAKPKSAPNKFDYIDSVAERLRETARKYEDTKTEVFLVLRGIRMRRVTGTQDFLANAVLQISRQGFRIDFVTLNSKTGKPRSLEKKWTDTIGATPNQFEIYFKDHSFVEFVPMDRDTHLFLSGFWQVFNPGLNGYPEQFQNPVKSGLGLRLREVANYIVDNKSEVGSMGALDVERVPTKISAEEFHGIYDPQIPKKGEKLGRWRLVQELGSGAFGTVFRVENVDDGRVRALKLMSPTYKKQKLKVDSPEFRILSDGFLDEAKLSSKVNSPFVVSAIEWGQEPWPWILYPFIEGQSPHQELRNSSNPKALWWNFAHDLISALNSIHSEGLLHRDVKPENIRGTKDRFVLLDLGIGQIKGYSDLVGGSFGGTVGYMAPEILLNPRGDHGYATDIFSAGMTLLSLFDDMTMKKLRDAELRMSDTGADQSLRDLLQAPLDLTAAPRETHALLSAMLDPNPNQRPPAKKLLAYVSDFVDLEEKIQLIQAHNALKYESVEVEDQREEERTEGNIRGPFNSWQKMEKEIYHILETVRPRYFIVELKVEGVSETIYVQAINDGKRLWHVEAVSETFSDSSQSVELRKRMMSLGWTPPSGSEPNWGMDFTEPPYPEIVRVFTDAFEFGYQIKPPKVISIEITKQGEGHY